MWISVSIFIVLVDVSKTMVEDSTYCSEKYMTLCQDKGMHVGCTFPTPGPSDYCHNYTQVKFNTELKTAVTQYINRHRQRLAEGFEIGRAGKRFPRPHLMMFVEWDRELAMLAQRLADQCHFVHDECRATVRYPYAGQTVGEVRWLRTRDSEDMSTKRAIRRILDAWWGEKRRADPNQITAPFKMNKGVVWGHFSQLAVWELQAVGCGAVRHGKYQPKLLLVCDFSHTNMLGQPTIIPGELKPCPLNTNTMRNGRSPYPLLCMPINQRTSNYSEDGGIEEEADSPTYDSRVSQEGLQEGQVENNFEQSYFDEPQKMAKAKHVDDIFKVDNDKGSHHNVDKKTKGAKNSRGMIQKYVARSENRWREDRERDSSEDVENHDDYESVTKRKHIIHHKMNTDKRSHHGHRKRVTDFSKGTTQPSSHRHRWKPDRFRRKRPGASALLTKSTDSTTKKAVKIIVFCIPCWKWLCRKCGNDEIFDDCCGSAKDLSHSGPVENKPLE